MSYLVDNRFGNKVANPNTCLANVSSLPELQQDVRDLEVLVFGMASMSLGPASPAPRRRSVAATAAAAASSITSGVTSFLNRSSAAAETPRQRLPVRMERPTQLPVADESASILARGRDTLDRADDTLRRAAETRRQEAARRGIPVTSRSNPDEENLRVSMRAVEDTLRASNDMGAAGASLPPLRIEPNGVCTFCQEEFKAGDDLVKLVCDSENGVQHCFHRDCLQGWGATYTAQGCTTFPCPLCRHQHNISDLHTPAAVEQPRGFVRGVRNVVDTARNVWSASMGMVRGVDPETSEEHDPDENELSDTGHSSDVDSEQSYDAEVEDVEADAEPRVENAITCQQCLRIGHGCRWRGMPGHYPA